MGCPPAPEVRVLAGGSVGEPASEGPAAAAGGERWDGCWFFC